MVTLFIISLLALKASAAPMSKRQFDISSVLGGLTGGSSTVGILPTGINNPFSTPTGLFGGLTGGSGTSNSPFSIPTSLLGGGSLTSSGLDVGSILGSAGTSGVSGSTANDVTSGACKDVTFIFARGTSEPGNMGTVIGPPFASALKSAVGSGSVAVQGVDYPADVAGAVSGSTSPKTAAGATKMAALAKQAIQQCSKTKIVLSGYSQGAQQVHGALMNLDSTSLAKVAAVVTFGDPLSKSAFQGIEASKAKVFCASGDAVCNNSFVITAAHLSYGSDAQDAASFVKSQL